MLPYVTILESQQEVSIYERYHPNSRCPGRVRLRVLFDDGKEADYPFSGLEDIDLAYAITIHKSQGSEYPAVIIILLPGPKNLLNRNLLYTAVTRARKCVVLAGDPQVFEEMIENVSQQRRYSGLKDRLLEMKEDPAIV